MAGGGGQAIDDLFALMLYWVATLLSAFLAKGTRLSPLVFYLIFGMVLANAKLVKRSEFLTSFAEVCITVVFFALGLEENVAHFKTGIRKAWGIASIGAIVPFAIGYGCMFLFWPGTNSKVALMGGLAVTATAVSLTMISLKAEGLASSKPAIGIMTSAVLDDIASLALVAVCVPIATGEAEPTAAGILWIMAKASLFFLCIFVAHAILFPHNVTSGLLSHVPVIRRFGLHHLLRFASGEQATLMSLLVAVFFGMVSHWWGFHPTIGAYMSGLILEERYYDLKEEGNTYQHTLHQIEEAAFGWLGPVFFVHLGTTFLIDIDVLANTFFYSLLFFVFLAIGQFLSAAFAARYVPGGFTWADSAMIGFGMLGRAELFFVVLNICYIEHSILTREQFFTFTITALLLDIAVPICIAVYKPFYMRAQDEVCVVKVVDCKEGGPGDEENMLSQSWKDIEAHTNKKVLKSEVRKKRRILTLNGDEIVVGSREGSKEAMASPRTNSNSASRKGSKESQPKSARAACSRSAEDAKTSEPIQAVEAMLPPGALGGRRALNGPPPSTAPRGGRSAGGGRACAASGEDVRNDGCRLLRLRRS